MINKFTLGALPALLVAAMLTTSVSAATSVVVTPTDEQGWSTASTNAGGDVNFVTDLTSPYADGALQLTTDETNAARAQYMHGSDVALADLTDLSYYTKQNAGPVHAAPSYQLLVDLNGEGEGGFTTLVYEPYWNGAVTAGTWQQWDVDAGNFW